MSTYYAQSVFLEFGYYLFRTKDIICNLFGIENDALLKP